MDIWKTTSREAKSCAEHFRRRYMENGFANNVNDVSESLNIGRIDGDICLRRPTVKVTEFHTALCMGRYEFVMDCLQACGDEELVKFVLNTLIQYR